MGSTRTQVGDFGIWIHRAGQITEAEARRTTNECDSIVDGFESDFCIIVDRQHLESIEERAVAIFRSLVAENAPDGLKRLAVVYDGQLLGPHIEPAELPPRFRNALRYFDTSRSRTGR